MDVHEWRRIAGEIARTILAHRGEAIATGILRHARSRYSHTCIEHFASADALAEAQAGIDAAQEDYATVLRRLPDEIAQGIEASELAQIAAATEYLVDSPLGVLLFKTMTEGQGFHVATTKRRSAFRRIGEFSHPDRETAILQDGTTRSAGFLYCSTHQGERTLREAVLRLVRAKPWIFDRQDLAASAGRLLERQRSADEALEGFYDAAFSLSGTAQSLGLARTAYLQTVIEQCPELSEMPALITALYEVSITEDVDPADDVGAEEEADAETASGPSRLW